MCGLNFATCQGRRMAPGLCKRATKGRLAGADLEHRTRDRGRRAEERRQTTPERSGFMRTWRS